MPDAGVGGMTPLQKNSIHIIAVLTVQAAVFIAFLGKLGAVDALFVSGFALIGYLPAPFLYFKRKLTNKINRPASILFDILIVAYLAVSAFAFIYDMVWLIPVMILPGIIISRNHVPRYFPYPSSDITLFLDERDKLVFYKSTYISGSIMFVAVWVALIVFSLRYGLGNLMPVNLIFFITFAGIWMFVPAECCNHTDSLPQRALAMKSPEKISEVRTEVIYEDNLAPMQKSSIYAMLWRFYSRVLSLLIHFCSF